MRREAIIRVSSLDERHLLAACRRGDPEALRRLVDDHYDLLYRFLWRLTAAPEEASELTQETFVRALERIDRFDGRASFTTWLHAIALNLWRSARRRLRTSTVPLESVPAQAAVTACDEEAMACLERDEIRRAIERLPESQRVAILLFYYQGLSYAEIASICHRPVGTVGSWIHHGLRRLRRLLEDPDIVIEPRAPATPCACREEPT